MRHGKLEILSKKTTHLTETPREILPFGSRGTNDSLSIEERRQALLLSGDRLADCYSDSEIIFRTRRLLPCPAPEELAEARAWLAGRQIENLAIKLLNWWGALR